MRNQFIEDANGDLVNINHIIKLCHSGTEERSRVYAQLTYGTAVIMHGTDYECRMYIQRFYAELGIAI